MANFIIRVFMKARLHFGTDCPPEVFDWSIKDQRVSISKRLGLLLVKCYIRPSHFIAIAPSHMSVRQYTLLPYLLSENRRISSLLCFLEECSRVFDPSVLGHFIFEYWSSLNFFLKPHLQLESFNFLLNPLSSYSSIRVTFSTRVYWWTERRHPAMDAADYAVKSATMSATALEVANRNGKTTKVSECM